MFYIDGAYRGMENSWKNPQKIVKTACNFQNMVYSMSSYREFSIHQAKES